MTTPGGSRWVMALCLGVICILVLSARSPPAATLVTLQASTEAKAGGGGSGVPVNDAAAHAHCPPPLQQQNRTGHDRPQPSEAAVAATNSYHPDTNGNGNVNGTAARPSLLRAIRRFCQEQPEMVPTGMPSARQAQALQEMLSPFVELEPPAPLTVTQRPVPLARQLDCRRVQLTHVLTGAPRPNPVKVYDLIIFNNDVDLLEMRLFELEDSVDVFVILECLYTHRGVPKRLFYHHNRHRFRRWWDRIFHVVLDDSELERLLPRRATGELQAKRQTNEVDWTIEMHEREQVMKKLIAGKNLKPDKDDVFIHGDVDEIPSGLYLYHLKHCQPRRMPLGSVNVFYIYNTRFVFNADFPGRPDAPQSFQFPDFFTYPDFLRGFRRDFGRGGKLTGVVPGGMHLNHYGYLPFLLYKQLAQTENGDTEHDFCQWTADTIRHRQEDASTGSYVPYWSHRTFPVNRARNVEFFVPWIVQANPKRYPYALGVGTADHYL